MSTLQDDQNTLLTIYRPVLLKMRNVSSKSCGEYHNTFCVH